MPGGSVQGTPGNGSRRREEADARMVVSSNIRLVTSAAIPLGYFIHAIIAGGVRWR